jgi:hypothetical protein
VCCSGTCRDTRANNQYCGSCTANCQDQGFTCRTISGVGYACGSCASNAACRDVLDGSGNSDVTCYDVDNPPAYCQCQCPSCGPNCVCRDGGCGPNAYCYECSGTNVCKPFSGSCP